MTDLHERASQLTQALAELKDQQLALDLTRGKPCAEQLKLSQPLDGILNADYLCGQTDTRNYGLLDGLPQLKPLFADILQTPAESLLLGGNSSLELMHKTLMFAHFIGLFAGHKPWAQQNTPIRFLCPVPGYDRHFKICESLGIEMLNVAMLDDGPDMDAVESMVKSDPGIKGIWNVPRFSNPTGITYSDAVVKRMAALPTLAAPDFIVLWDNAYAVHEFVPEAAGLASISAYAAQLGTMDQIIQFASTSKITFAGSGVAALATGSNTLARFTELHALSTIGPDKVNQLRHLRLFPDFAALQKHMEQHAQLIKPRFDAVLRILETHLDADMGQWTIPDGGYFISFNTQPGQAQAVVDLCAEAGVKMTPAGATFPYGRDPEDRNIRIAPSFATLADIETAMQVFVICVQLVNIRQQLKQHPSSASL